MREVSSSPTHVFEIDARVWNAIGAEEMAATVSAMQEFGIYKLPYDDGQIIIRLRHDDDGSPSGFHQVTEVKGLQFGESFHEEVLMYPKQAQGAAGFRYYKNFVQKLEADGKVVSKWTDPHYKMVDLGAHLEGKRVVHRYQVFCEAGDIDSQKHFRDGLIVLLASKGLVKETKERKLAKLGIGKRRDEYITTIKLGQNLESHESVRPGQPVRPHLRRGHKRSQHYGAGNELVKDIWIDPVFVNADENFVSTRKAYRVVH